MTTTAMNCYHLRKDRTRISPRTFYCTNCGALGKKQGARFDAEARGLSYRVLEGIAWLVPRTVRVEEGSAPTIDEKMSAAPTGRIARRQRTRMGHESARALPGSEADRAEEDPP